MLSEPSLFQLIQQQLRQRMHDPVPQTGKWLQSIVRGHFNYYADQETSRVLGDVSGSGAGAMVAHSASPPDTLDLLDAYPRLTGNVWAIRIINDRGARRIVSLKPIL